VDMQTPYMYPSILILFPLSAFSPPHIPPIRILHIAIPCLLGRKLRCDGVRPTCSHCVMRGLMCAYAEFPKRRGPGKAPRGSRAKKNAQARAIAESSVVFKNGVDASAFKAKPTPMPKGGGGTRGREVAKGKEGAGIGIGTNLSGMGTAAQWPASVMGTRARGGLVQEGAGFAMDGMSVGTRLPANAVTEEHEYELEMLAPEVRPYASVMTLDTFGSGPPVPQRPPHQASAPTLSGYGGTETMYGETETGASGLAPGLGISGAAGGTAAGG
jgi:hypothetical protein